MMTTSVILVVHVLNMKIQCGKLLTIHTYHKDQGSRIEDRMVVESALDLKEKVPSAPTPGHRGSRP